ncbi:MAG: glycosyltransferase [Opitutae bacterium]|nr:glycosyltransferase [Opitutae bacterium]
MKIIFITGSLEPGRTGVGDYTRLIAKACAGLGHQIQMIGLNDLFLTNEWEGEMDGIRSLRLPDALTWEYRWQKASRFIDKFGPDWISLQFVPYAFHPRGFFNQFLDGFSTLARKQKLHIKFHEIWIGEYPGAPLKERVVGWLQKRLILKLLQMTAPKIIHYTNAGSKVRMERAGIIAQYLPIFGNIKIAKKKKADWLSQQLALAGKPMSKPSIKRFLWFGFFGSIHPKWPARRILERLRMYTNAQDKRPGLLHVGIIEKHRNRWKEIQKKYSGDWLIHSLGPQPEDNVSHYLHSLHFGLTSTPWDLVGKSGTIAAMVEHGLPVIINIDGGTPKAPLVIQEKFMPLIIRSDEQLLQNLSRPPKHKPTRLNIITIAEMFIESLEQKRRSTHSLIA